MRSVTCVIMALALSLAWAAPHEGDHQGHTPEQFHHLHHAAGEPHHAHAHGHAHDGSQDHSCHSLAPFNADFAFALYRSLSAKAGAGNVFYSPVGIAMALSMLATGAKGDTHSQLFGALGYGAALTQEQVNEAYEHLLHMVGHARHDMVLDMGNALALHDGFKALPKFLKDVRHYYASEDIPVDFTKPEQAVAKINSFVAKKTHDKITDLVKELSPDSVMVLINYVLFRGKWEKPFEASLTTMADFEVNNNATVQVDMMKRTGRYDIYNDLDNHTTVIMLPYKGNTSMMVVLPDKGKMAEVEAYINKDYIKHWHNSLFRSSVDLYLPKFSISASASLDDTLKGMGMVNAFGDTADFSGISDTKLKVSKVAHKAVLSVDETGTEAAAATTIEIMPMSLPDTINLNRPFLVLILEHSTRSVLFMGKITDPTAK